MQGFRSVIANQGAGGTGGQGARGAGGGGVGVGQGRTVITCGDIC